jgi:hypothetical protein
MNPGRKTSGSFSNKIDQPFPMWIDGVEAFGTILCTKKEIPSKKGGATIQMRVVCGDPDCREEFPVSSKDAVWECTSCGRQIVNRKYPFLTAKLMQANIDGDTADWKAIYSDLLEQARLEIVERSEGKDPVIDLSFLEEGDKLIESNEVRENREWRDLHDDLLLRAREVVLQLDELNK